MHFWCRSRYYQRFIIRYARDGKPPCGIGTAVQRPISFKKTVRIRYHLNSLFTYLFYHILQSGITVFRSPIFTLVSLATTSNNITGFVPRSACWSRQVSTVEIACSDALMRCSFNTQQKKFKYWKNIIMVWDARLPGNIECVYKNIP